jgi:hypothetical protein
VPIVETRPDWTYKGSRDALPQKVKQKKPKPDTSALAEREVLLVLRAIADGEQSYHAVRAATGISSTRTIGAAMEAKERGWLTERWEQREGEPLGRNYFYAITNAGRERLRTDTNQLSRLAGDDVL